MSIYIEVPRSTKSRAPVSNSTSCCSRMTRAHGVRYTNSDAKEAKYQEALQVTNEFQNQMENKILDFKRFNLLNGILTNLSLRFNDEKSKKQKGQPFDEKFIESYNSDLTEYENLKKKIETNIYPGYFFIRNKENEIIGIDDPRYNKQKTVFDNFTKVFKKFDNFKAKVTDDDTKNNTNYIDDYIDAFIEEAELIFVEIKNFYNIMDIGILENKTMLLQDLLKRLEFEIESFPKVLENQKKSESHNFLFSRIKTYIQINEDDKDELIKDIQSLDTLRDQLQEKINNLEDQILDVTNTKQYQDLLRQLNFVKQEAKEISNQLGNNYLKSKKRKVVETTSDNLADYPNNENDDNEEAPPGNDANME